MSDDDQQHPRIIVAARPVAPWVRTVHDWLLWRHLEDERMVDELVEKIVAQYGDAQPAIDVAALRAMLLEDTRRACWGTPQ